MRPDRQLVRRHGLQQISARGGERMAGSSRKSFSSDAAGRQSDAVFGDESAEAAAVAFVAQRAGQQGKMNVASGFVPRAERAGRDVFADALFRAAEKASSQS